MWQGRGSWRIVLVRGPRGRDASDAEAASPPSAEGEAGTLRGWLTDRGVYGEGGGRARGGPPGAMRSGPGSRSYDWLVARKDKKVGKNPAGYLVASIRDRYAPPEGFAPPDEADRLAEAERQAAEDERKRRDLERVEADRSARKEAELKARWAALDDADREEIAAQVRAENPGLRRWKAMMEPLCLVELERRLMGGPAKPRGPSQGSLFPDSKPTK